MTSTKRFIRLMAALLALIFVVNTAPLTALAEGTNPPAAEQADHDHDHDHDHEHEDGAAETAQGEDESLISQLTDEEGNTIFREVKFALPDKITEEEAKEITLPEPAMLANGTLIFAVPQPVRPDYNFNGWYYDAALNEPADGWDVIDRNMTLYPSFSPIQEYGSESRINYISEINVEPDYQIGIVAYGRTETEIREMLKVTDLDIVEGEEEYVLERMEPDLYTLIPDDAIRTLTVDTIKAFKEGTLEDEEITRLTDALAALKVPAPESELTEEEEEAAYREKVIASGERTTEEEIIANAMEVSDPALEEDVIEELVAYYAPEEAENSEARFMADLLHRAETAGFDTSAVKLSELTSILTKTELASLGLDLPDTDGMGSFESSDTALDLESIAKPYIQKLPPSYYIVRPAGGKWHRGHMHQVEILDTKYLRFWKDGQKTSEHVIYNNIKVYQENFNNTQFRSNLIYLPAAEVEGVKLDCGLFKAEGNTDGEMDLVSGVEEGVMTYSGSEKIPVGATVVVYDGTIGEKGRVDGSVGYFKIKEDLGGGQYAFGGPEYDDVIFLPDMIPAKDDGTL